MKKNYRILIIFLSIVGLFLIYLVYKSFELEKVNNNHALIDSIIVVGDSRMELIANKKHYTKELPLNMEFIAESGKTFYWFDSYAIPKLTTKLTDKNKQYKVVINMGVNDIQFSDNLFLSAKEYSKSFVKLAHLYPNVKFYIMSANPINEKLINNYIEENVRTNKKIEKFNSDIFNHIKTSRLSNIKYCNAYNNINFKTRDGLHYTIKTNEKIIDYIVNDCIK